MSRQQLLASTRNWADISSNLIMAVNNYPGSGWGLFYSASDTYYCALKERKNKGIKPTHHTVVHYPKK